MRITFYANLRQIAGQKSITLHSDETVSLEQLITRLVSRYPEMARALLNEDGRLSEHVRIFADGKDVLSSTAPENVQLSPQARIDLFPAIAGG